MVGMLYLFTGIMSLYWTLLTLRDVYGPPRLWWFIFLVGGSLGLITGASYAWISTQRWAMWIPVVGSSMLTAFLIPMALRILAQYPDGIVAELPTLLATKAFVLALVLTSLAVSTLQRMRAHSAGPNPK